MKRLKNTAIPALAATLAGLCNSLLGAGGGILLSLAAQHLCEGIFDDRRDALINSQAAMIAGCALSCLIYYLKGDRAPTAFSVFITPALLGGMIGALLLSRIRTVWVVRLFAALVIFSGFRMLLG